MNDNYNVVNFNDDIDTDVSVVPETTITEDQTEVIETDIEEQSDTSETDIEHSSSEDLILEDLLAEQPASTAEGATAVDAAAIYEPICYKLDLIIMLLVIIFAAYMLKGLANPYKLGGRHIGKSS